MLETKSVKERTSEDSLLTTIKSVRNMVLGSGQFTPEELSTMELSPEEEDIARAAHASASAYRVHATAALNGDMSMFAESLRIAEATAESFRKKTQMSLMKLTDCTFVRRVWLAGLS